MLMVVVGSALTIFLDLIVRAAEIHTFEGRAHVSTGTLSVLLLRGCVSPMGLD